MPLPTYQLDDILDGIEGILFDMDGVLLDTEDLYTEATREILGPLGERFDFRLKEKIMGRDPLIAAQTLLDGVGSQMSVEDYFRLRQPVMTRLFAACSPIPGAPELVTHLAERGFPLAVATSSDRDFFSVKTAHHPWFDRFGAVVCGSDAEVLAHKPAPDIFLAAAAALGLPPERCLVLEDSPAGVQAARAAKVKCIIARCDPRIDRSLLDGADYTVESYAQLLHTPR